MVDDLLGVEEVQRENKQAIRKNSWSAYLELLKNRNFLFLWLGQGISNIGDWLIIGPLVIFISGKYGSALAVSGLVTAKILPALFFGSVVGVLIDRLPRKKTMILCDILRGGLVILIPFARSLYQIYLIVFCMDTLSLFFMPSKDASIPNIVERDHIITANSLSYITNQSAMVLGLGFSATIILIVEKIWGHLPIFHNLAGPYVAFYVDAMTFFISASTIALIHLPPSVHVISKIHFAQIKNDLVEGIRFLKENPLIRAMIGSIGLAILGGGGLYTLGYFYSEQVLKTGRTGFVPLLTAFAVGSLLGALFSGAASHYLPKEKLFVLSIFTFGLSLSGFSGIPYYESAILFSVSAGIAGGLAAVTLYTVLQEKVEDLIRGRIFTALESVLRISLLVSVALTAAIADLIGERQISFGGYAIHLNGARTTLFLGGIMVTLAGVFAYRAIVAPAER